MKAENKTPDIITQRIFRSYRPWINGAEVALNERVLDDIYIDDVLIHPTSDTKDAEDSRIYGHQRRQLLNTALRWKDALIT
jgi:hypothetical protein